MCSTANPSGCCWLPPPGQNPTCSTRPPLNPVQTCPTLALLGRFWCRAQVLQRQTHPSCVWLTVVAYEPPPIADIPCSNAHRLDFFLHPDEIGHSDPAVSYEENARNKRCDHNVGNDVFAQTDQRRTGTEVSRMSEKRCQANYTLAFKNKIPLTRGPHPPVVPLWWASYIA